MDSLWEQMDTLDRCIRDTVAQLSRFVTTLGSLQHQITGSGTNADAFDLPVLRTPGVPLDARSQPTYVIRLLGPPSIECDLEPVSLARRGKAESILKALALGRDRRVPAGLLAEWVWPGLDAGEARHSLQTTVSAMRRSFRRMHAGFELVVFRGDAYQLDEAVVTDIELFDTAFAKAIALERDGLGELALGALLATLPLYRGDLDVDEFEDLRFLIERERLIGTNLQILSKVSAMQFQRGNWEESIAYATRLLASDPSREDAHRLIIRSYARMGQRSQAMRHYHLCERIIREQFDTAVEPETAALLADLLG